MPPDLYPTKAVEIAHGRKKWKTLSDPEVLKQMILAVAGRARAGAELSDEGELEVILPEAVAGLEELRSIRESCARAR